MHNPPIVDLCVTMSDQRLPRRKQQTGTTGQIFQRNPWLSFRY